MLKFALTYEIIFWFHLQTSDQLTKFLTASGITTYSKQFYFLKRNSKIFEAKIFKIENYVKKNQIGGITEAL